MKFHPPLSVWKFALEDVHKGWRGTHIGFYGGQLVTFITFIVSAAVVKSNILRQRISSFWRLWLLAKSILSFWPESNLVIMLRYSIFEWTIKIYRPWLFWWESKTAIAVNIRSMECDTLYQPRGHHATEVAIDIIIIIIFIITIVVIVVIISTVVCQHEHYYITIVTVKVPTVFDMMNIFQEFESLLEYIWNGKVWHEYISEFQSSK